MNREFDSSGFEQAFPSRETTLSDDETISRPFKGAAFTFLLILVETCGYLMAKQDRTTAALRGVAVDRLRGSTHSY
jgi:hypothetical protein